MSTIPTPEPPHPTWKLIVPNSAIDTAVKRLADICNREYKKCEKEILVVAIMKGAVYFFVDFTRELTFPHSTYFLDASSYKNGKTQGSVETSTPIHPEKFKGKSVILIDELFDNGHTMDVCRRKIHEEGGVDMEDIHTIALMKKNKGTERTPYLDSYGIMVPNVWLVGYGLDDKGEKRNLKDVWGVPKSVEDRKEGKWTKDDEDIFG